MTVSLPLAVAIVLTILAAGVGATLFWVREPETMQAAARRLFQIAGSVAEVVLSTLRLPGVLVAGWLTVIALFAFWFVVALFWVVMKALSRGDAATINIKLT